MTEKQQVTIILVEDDPGHARLIEKNLRRANITNDIVILNDGQQAVDYVFCEGDYAGHPLSTPLLLLLDLNMPVLDGYQVLKRIKTDEEKKRIPIVILTTTDDDQEVTHCYDLGCNIYLTKPVDYQQFSQAIRKLGLFLSIVAVPDTR